MSIEPAVGNKHTLPETQKAKGGELQMNQYELNQEIHTPVISYLGRSLAITGMLIQAYGTKLQNFEALTKAHDLARMAHAEAKYPRGNRS